MGLHLKGASTNSTHMFSPAQREAAFIAKPVHNQTHLLMNGNILCRLASEDEGGEEVVMDADEQAVWPEVDETMLDGLQGK